MLKIITVIGARPQIIKAAALSRAIHNHFSQRIREIIIHTGQHYDASMSQVFFDELGIPEPHYNLGVGSGPHGRQTARMIEGLENILLNEQPGFLVLYGDTNSTLAGAIAASKLHIPIVHIEAGLRSFNKSMPEEINRIMCDHVSTLLFSPTETGLANLIREGFKEAALPPWSSDNPKIYHCGDVMYDNTLYFAQMAEEKSEILEAHGLISGNYLLSTIHRDNNTDIPERLNAIFKALDTISRSREIQVVMPLHPRTARLLKQNLTTEIYSSVNDNKLIKVIPPVSFLDMTRLEKNARLILTDSGGVQKEAYFFEKPCVIARSETEWVEIVEAGAGIIADADSERLSNALEAFLDHPPIQYPKVFGDGEAARFICDQMLKMAEGEGYSKTHKAVKDDLHDKNLPDETKKSGELSIPMNDAFRMTDDKLKSE
ncbi:MAG: UDP-N-acetylglucosamine 2-epimerase (non-hydrolyzing) [Lentimicrobium sp.]|jgi:UDP-GlcNAc3NAcA epimerase|nr:UDP-N-acetylglucosamine 2-epimerase (non-hydrolyzing) [Lentimicrobium sp.]MDD2527796.1 UDP-N-acetylglucosamine 2-epimerase (non-hydrolyzing) [Lentimicrobiaceae bacterium]MDD4598445.1 UDP-N-acetylglucosamine 2-epimerase (non-hydrolyzing) [Lentimicrobiaceae bacterium]MDY0025725.1 UDP-N-acetylglucosamine 2-epimerase (non-hydrolyzing) [Lentimicrobium sp.]